MPRKTDPARIDLFIASYKSSLNAKAAAIHAGYSPHSALKTGCKLLRKPAVEAALAAQAEGEFQIVERQAGRVLAEAARVAFADPGRLFDAQGRLKPVADMDGDALAALSAVEETRKGGVRLVRRGKLAALALLARYLQLMAPGAGVPAPDESAPLLKAPRKARFAAEYTVDFNATCAAIRAGYTPRWAQNRGYKLLCEPAVQAAIAARAQSRFARSAIAPERVLREIARVALFDARRLVPASGVPRDIRDLDDDTRAVFAMIEMAPPGCAASFKFRCLNKLVALRLLKEILEAREPPGWGRATSVARLPQD